MTNVVEHLGLRFAVGLQFKACFMPLAPGIRLRRCIEVCNVLSKLILALSASTSQKLVESMALVTSAGTLCVGDEVAE